MAGNVPFLMSEAECGWEPEENFVLHKWNSMKGSSKWFRIYFKEWKRTREMFNSKISKNANNLSFCFHHFCTSASVIYGNGCPSKRSQQYPNIQFRAISAPNTFTWHFGYLEMQFIYNFIFIEIQLIYSTVLIWGYITKWINFTYTCIYSLF